jgi:transcriptional regulator with XRE-family HTH domain
MDQTQHEIKKLVRENRLKIGKAIRLIREKKGYSQDHLADLMNVSRTTISKIENGRFSVSIDYLTKLSIYLNFNFALIED